MGTLLNKIKAQNEKELIYLEPGNPYGVVGYVTMMELRQLEREFDEAEHRWEEFERLQPTVYETYH